MQALVAPRRRSPMTREHIQKMQAAKGQKLQGLMNELSDVVAKADIIVKKFPDFYSVKSAQAAIAANPKKYKGWTVRAEDRDGDGYNDDVVAYDQYMNQKVINTVGLGGSRYFNEKPSKNKRKYDWHEANPTRVERRSHPLSTWEHENYPNLPGKPYATFVKMCSAIAKQDPRFTNGPFVGKLGNDVRMKATGVLWNAVALKTAFPNVPQEYNWFTDPNGYKNNKELKAQLPGALARNGVLIHQRCRENWNNAINSAMRSMGHGGGGGGN